MFYELTFDTIKKKKNYHKSIGTKTMQIYCLTVLIIRSLNVSRAPFLWETLGSNPLPCLCQLLEAHCIPCLLASSSIFKKNITLNLSLSSHLLSHSNFLYSSYKTQVVTLGPPS